MSKEIYISPQQDMESEASFDSTGKKKSFRRLITRFAEKTSMQGPPYINMAKLWWAKVIWAILLLCAVAAMVLHLWYLFSQWYSWPKTTVISLGFDDLVFPQVTICNTNVLNRNRFSKYEGAKELKMLVDDLKPENFVPHQFGDTYDPETDKKVPPGQHREDGNQQGGTEQGGNQPGGTEQGGNQQGGTEQGGNQPGGTEQGGNQQGGTEQGGNQQGGTEQGGNLPNGTDQGGPEHGGNQPGGTSVSTKPTTKVGGQQGGNLGTTEVGKNRTDRTTSRTRTTTGSMGNKTTQTTTSPRPRKKRFVSNYEYLNASDYVEDYEDIDDEAGDGPNSPIDSQTKLENVFRQLYMDIEKSKRKDLGHDIKDMLVGCTFNGRQCNSGNFKLHQTSEYGNCWTISSDKFVVRRSGPGGGLTIVLFLETSEYLKGLTTGYGARIQFQERDTYPFPYDEGVFISGAMETDIGLKLRTVNRLGGDYGTCNDGLEFMKWYNLTYTRRACQAFCRITTVIKNCECFDDDWEEFAFKKDNTLRPCRTAKETVCLKGILREFRNGALSCTCDNPCRETDYVKSVSARQWPTNEYARVLLDWVCDKDPGTCRNLRQDINNIWNIKNNFLKLNIYYEDLNFENITETAQIELQQFLSDIGGAFGLWIGLSILSLCEVIQLFIELFDYGIHKTRNSHEANTKSKDKEGRKSPEHTGGGEKEPEHKLPRFAFSPTDRLSRHMRDDSPFREQDSSYHSDTGSSENKHKRKHDLEPYGSHSPNLRVHGESPILYRGQYLEPDRISHNSDRGSDRKRHRHRHRSRSQDVPRRGRNDNEIHDNYSKMKDYMGLGRPNLFY